MEEKTEEFQGKGRHDKKHVKGRMSRCLRQGRFSSLHKPGFSKTVGGRMGLERFAVGRLWIIPRVGFRTLDLWID